MLSPFEVGSEGLPIWLPSRSALAFSPGGTDRGTVPASGAGIRGGVLWGMNKRNLESVVCHPHQVPGITDRALGGCEGLEGPFGVGGPAFRNWRDIKRSDWRDSF
jgi:hypothetical protein